jgi:hypothetical protein
MAASVLALAVAFLLGASGYGVDRGAAAASPAAEGVEVCLLPPPDLEICEFFYLFRGSGVI